MDWKIECLCFLDSKYLGTKLPVLGWLFIRRGFKKWKLMEFSTYGLTVCLCKQVIEICNATCTECNTKWKNEKQRNGSIYKMLEKIVIFLEKVGKIDA